jgi:hypothetical protein
VHQRDEHRQGVGIAAAPRLKKTGEVGLSCHSGTS